MGNRAVIGWTGRDNELHSDSVGVYLHWNGGRDSVEAFLAYCKACGFRSPSEDNYGVARFVQVVSNFFGSSGGGLSVGVDRIDLLDADNGDNGLYVCKGWSIVGREHFKGEEQNVHDMLSMLEEINLRQPEYMQMSSEQIQAIAKQYQAKSESPVFAPEDM